MGKNKGLKAPATITGRSVTEAPAGCLLSWFRLFAELFFQFRDALEQVRQTLDGNHLAFGLLVRLRRRAQPFFAVRNVVHHARLR